MRAGWKLKRLADVATILMGQSPKGNSYNTTGEGVPLINGPVEFGKRAFSRTKRTKFTTEPTKMCKKGDLILCVRGSTTGRMNIAGYDSCIGRGVAAIRSPEHQDWINAFINANRETIFRLGAGATFPNVSGKMLCDFQIPLPPIPEQKRIVAILDEAFEGISQAVANAEKNLANARELFESYLNSVFTRKGEGWVETSLGNEIDLLTGFAFKSKGYTCASDGINLLRGDNIVQGFFRWSGVKKWPADDVESYKQYCLEKDDVVLAMDRTWVKSGLKFAQISKNDLPCLLVQRVARLRVKKSLDSNFLKYLIGSSCFTRYVLSIQTGLGVPHISGSQIKNFKFWKPPLVVQQDIAVNCDLLQNQTQRLESIYQQKLTVLTELKQSILQKAFTGELTAETIERLAVNA